MTDAKHWAVTVAVNGAEVLTIESNCLSGVNNIDDYKDEVATAGLHLLSFIGKGDSEVNHGLRETAFWKWWNLSCHNATLPRSRESLAREAYYAAWGGGSHCTQDDTRAK